MVALCADQPDVASCGIKDSGTIYWPSVNCSCTERNNVNETLTHYSNGMWLTFMAFG